MELAERGRIRRLAQVATAGLIDRPVVRRQAPRTAVPADHDLALHDSSLPRFEQVANLGRPAHQPGQRAATALRQAGDPARERRSVREAHRSERATRSEQTVGLVDQRSCVTLGEQVRHTHVARNRSGDASAPGTVNAGGSGNYPAARGADEASRQRPNRTITGLNQLVARRTRATQLKLKGRRRARRANRQLLRGDRR